MSNEIMAISYDSADAAQHATLGGNELNRVLEDGRATLITCADPEGNEFDLVAG